MKIQWNDKPFVVALLLAFLPAAMLLSMIALLGQHVSSGLLVAASLISLVCCFVSSFMLFRRQTALAIVAAVLFLLLNGAIALFFGCASLFNK